jgi:hypothetical protein
MSWQVHRDEAEALQRYARLAGSNCLIMRGWYVQHVLVMCHSDCG